MRSTRRICDLVSTAFFVATISLPLLLTSSANWRAELEKRTAAAFPPLPSLAADMTAYTAAVDAYLADHFGFRRQLIDLRNRIEFFAFQNSPTPLVTVGKQGWLYFTGDRTDDDRRGRLRFSSEELARWHTAIADRKAWLAERGIAYLVVIVPNKQTIYPEFMPRAAPARTTTRAMQLADKLGGSEVRDNVLFLERPLLAAKGDMTLFHRLDSHWNAYGAYVAYRAVVERLSVLDRGPQTVVDLAKTQFMFEVEVDGDLSRMIGFPLQSPGNSTLPASAGARVVTDAPVDGTQFPGGGDWVVENANAAGHERVLFFCDSFATRFGELLEESYPRVRLAHRYPNDSDFKRYVEIERPTVVIEQRVERMLEVPQP